MLLSQKIQCVAKQKTILTHICEGFIYLLISTASSGRDSENKTWFLCGQFHIHSLALSRHSLLHGSGCGAVEQCRADISPNSEIYFNPTLTKAALGYINVPAFDPGKHHQCEDTLRVMTNYFIHPCKNDTLEKNTNVVFLTKYIWVFKKECIGIKTI